MTAKTDRDEPFDDILEEGQKRRRKMRRWAIGLAALLVAATVGVALNMSASRANGEEHGDETAESAENGDEKAPVPVEVVAAERGPISAYISSTANLVAEEDVEIIAEVEGRVADLRVEEGDYVSHGRVLAVLDRSDEIIAVKKAESRHVNAELAYKRGQDLFGKELISREENDKLTVDYEIAEQELAEAQVALDKTTIRAPFSGRVTERMIQRGQHMRPGDVLFQVTDFDPLIARIFLPETDVLDLAEGQDVQIALNADSTVEFSGRIRQISPVVDTATGTVKVTIEAADPPAVVRPGSFVSVHIVRERNDQALRIPKDAVLRELQDTHIFVFEGEAAAKRTVELGIEEGDWVQVVAGLEAGEQVIVAGQGGLKEGTKVRLLGEETPETVESDSEAS